MCGGHGTGWNAIQTLNVRSTINAMPVRTVEEVRHHKEHYSKKVIYKNNIVLMHAGTVNIAFSQLPRHLNRTQRAWLIYFNNLFAEK